MTFAPEWVTGSVHLDTSNWLYLYVSPPRAKSLLSCFTHLACLASDICRPRWVYLVFFNGLWVVFPLWILRRAYLSLCRV